MIRHFLKLQNKKERANLRCFYFSALSKWLSLGPFQIQMHWSDPQIFVIKELLYGKERNNVVSDAGLKLQEWSDKHGSLGRPWAKIRVMKK